MFRVSELPNGIRVVTAHMPARESVAAGVWVRCGLRHEPRRLNGVSHFIEHYLFKGTRRRHADESARAIEGVGGVINASTEEECTVYFAHVPRDRFELALDVLLDMVLHAVFPAVHLERQREIILEEIRTNEDRPHAVAEDTFNEVLWPEHPLGWRILGTEKSVSRIRRSDLVGFKRRMYSAPRTVISAAGSVDHAETLRMIAARAAHLCADGREGSAPDRTVQRKPCVRLVKRPTEETHLVLGVKALRRDHPDRFGLRVISVLLGENMSSRLFHTVREERGLSYSIGSGVDQYTDTGCFYVSGDIASGRVAEAVRLIVRELRRLQGVRVPERELDHAKGYLSGQVALSMERTPSVMWWAGENLLLSGRVPAQDTVVEGIRRVRAADVQRIAARLFRPERLNAVVVGPEEKERPIEAALTAGGPAT